MSFLKKVNIPKLSALPSLPPLPDFNYRNLRSPLSAESRRRLAENDRRWKVKFGLLAAASVISLIGFSLFAAAIPKWNANFFHISGPQEGDWQDGLPLAPLLMSLLFSVGSIFYLLLTYRQPHPIVNLVMHFLIWALLIPGITFAAWGGLFEVWRPALRAPNGRVFCNILNSFARECNPILYSVGGLELGAVIFSCFLWVVEVALFVFACVETHRWRMERKYGSSRSDVPDGRFVELDDRVHNDDLGLMKETGTISIEAPQKTVNRYR